MRIEALSFTIPFTKRLFLHTDVFKLHLQMIYSLLIVFMQPLRFFQVPLLMVRVLITLELNDLIMYLILVNNYFHCLKSHSYLFEYVQIRVPYFLHECTSLYALKRHLPRKFMQTRRINLLYFLEHLQRSQLGIT